MIAKEPVGTNTQTCEETGENTFRAKITDLVSTW